MKQFAADVKAADEIRKEADAKLKTMKETTGDLRSDLDTLQKGVRQIDDLVKQDVEDVQTRLHIPNLDMNNMSKDVFGKMFEARLGSLRRYWVLIKQYLPPPKKKGAAEEEDFAPRKRGAGKNYHFPITSGYPFFWLKKATVSSEPTAEGLAGKVSGELTNVTSSPAYINKPAILDLTGEFARSEIYGVHLKVVADHIDEPKDALDLKVESFPLKDRTLVQNNELKLVIQKATGSSQLSATLHNAELSVNLNNEFKQIQYDVKVDGTAKEIISTVLSGIPVVTLNAQAKGPWDSPHVNINSNLGTELASGLQKYLQARIDSAKKRIEEQIYAQIKNERAQLDGEYDKIKDRVEHTLRSRQDDLDKVNSRLQTQTNSPKKASTDALKEKGKELLKKLKF